MKINQSSIQRSPRNFGALKYGDVFSYPNGEGFYMKIDDAECVKLDNGRVFGISQIKKIIYYPNAELHVGVEA